MFWVVSVGLLEWKTVKPLYWMVLFKTTLIKHGPCEFLKFHSWYSYFISMYPFSLFLLDTTCVIVITILHMEPFFYDVKCLISEEVCFHILMWGIIHRNLGFYLTAREQQRTFGGKCHNINCNILATPLLW